MAKHPAGVLVTVLRRPFVCSACQEKVFKNRDIEVRGDVFSTSAIGLECMTCGHLHTFIDGGQVEMYRPDFGYPT